MNLVSKSSGTTRKNFDSDFVWSRVDSWFLGQLVGVTAFGFTWRGLRDSFGENSYHGNRRKI